jgi:hypothetical protein
MTLAIKKKRTHTNPEMEKSRAELMKEDRYLESENKNLRLDLDKRLFKALESLSRKSEHIDENGKIKSVSMRMVVTEALVDVFEKYERGEGEYPLEADEEWSWKDYKAKK